MRRVLQRLAWPFRAHSVALHAALSELTRKIEQIGRGDRLSARVFHEKLPGELAPLARALDKMLDRIEATCSRLGAFAADAAHELRTPLQILSSEAEAALREDGTDGAYRMQLESSLDEYRRLGELVNKLLFIAQAWDPRTQIERVPIDVRNELDSIREYFEPLAAEGGQLILCDGQGRVDADPPLFRRAICNLVANALKHTPAMGRISLSVAAAMSDTVSVKVTDTGSGIAPQRLAQIQAARRRAAADDSAEPARFSGGLGLQIVGSIAELHDARLQIDTELGRGTTVELLFPRSPLVCPDNLSIEFPLEAKGRNSRRITET